MADWLIIPAGDAIRALADKRKVHALEAADEWGEVTAIEGLVDRGLLTPNHRISLARGRVRFETGAGAFRAERERRRL
jgi:hypothetical protein